MTSGSRADRPRQSRLIPLRRWVGHHTRGDMRAAMLGDLGQRVAAGAPMSADDLHLVSLLARSEQTSGSGS